MKLPSKLLGEQVKRGVILHSTIFENIDHGKFFVVIGVTDTCAVGFFYINSHIHPSIFTKKEQLSLQYPLLAKDYSFLRYDSYLCATEIIKRPLGELIASMDAGKTQIIDQLKDEHIAAILTKVRNSKLFSKKEKADFFS